MNDKMYLIHEEDYIKHIDEKVLLYSFVKQLTHHIAKMKSARENENLIKMAKYYDTAAENLFSFWGIPKSYLVFDKKEDLSELMENELITPEEMELNAGSDPDFIPATAAVPVIARAVKPRTMKPMRMRIFQKCWKLCPLSFTMCSGTTYRFTLSWSNP